MPLFRPPALRACPSSVSAACATSLQRGTGRLPRSPTCLLLSATSCLQGWSKFYEFSFSDQRAGVDVISLGTQNGRAPQWEYLHGLLENAIYGGRIDNGHDVLVSIEAASAWPAAVALSLTLARAGHTNAIGAGCHLCD